MAKKTPLSPDLIKRQSQRDFSKNFNLTVKGIGKQSFTLPKITKWNNAFFAHTPRTLDIKTLKEKIITELYLPKNLVSDISKLCKEFSALTFFDDIMCAVVSMTYAKNKLLYILSIDKREEKHNDELRQLTDLIGTLKTKNMYLSQLTFTSQKNTERESEEPIKITSSIILHTLSKLLIEHKSNFKPKHDGKSTHTNQSAISELQHYYGSWLFYYLSEKSKISDRKKLIFIGKLFVISGLSEKTDLSTDESVIYDKMCKKQFYKDLRSKK